MSASINDKITDVRNSARPTSTTVTVARASAGTNLSCNSLIGWPTASKVHFVTYQTDTNNDVVAGTQLDCYGIVSGDTITNIVVLDGTDGGNAIGDKVEMLPTAGWGQDLADGLMETLERDGSLQDNIVTTAKVNNLAITEGKLASAVQTKLNALSIGYIVTSGRGYAETTVFNSTEYTDTHGNDSGSSSESSVGNIMPISGTLRNLYIDPFANTCNGSTVFTLMKNGVATALTVTVAASTTTISSDTTHTESISAGDRISLKCVTTGSGSGQIDYGFSCLVN